jgi:hypothetical protein
VFVEEVLDDVVYGYIYFGNDKYMDVSVKWENVAWVGESNWLPKKDKT